MPMMKDCYVIEYPLSKTLKDWDEFRKQYKDKRYVVNFVLVDEPSVKNVTKEEFLSYISE